MAGRVKVFLVQNKLRSPGDQNHFGKTHAVRENSLTTQGQYTSLCGRSWVSSVWQPVIEREETLPECAHCRSTLTGAVAGTYGHRSIGAVLQASAKIQADLVIEASRARVDLLYANELIDRISFIHYEDKTFCVECEQPWPCQTINLINARGSVSRV